MDTHKFKGSVLSTRLLGWLYLVTMTISSVAVFFSDLGITAFFATALLAIFPGAALAFGAGAAFSGESLWAKVVLAGLAFTTLIGILSAFAGWVGALVALVTYSLSLLPLYRLSRVKRSPASSDRLIKIIFMSWITLFLLYLSLLWIQQLSS
jgi:hypothetical protein